MSSPTRSGSVPDITAEVTRRLVLHAVMPAVTRPLWPLVTARFDQENRRTMAALKRYAEVQSDGPGLPG